VFENKRAFPVSKEELSAEKWSMLALEDGTRELQKGGGSIKTLACLIDNMFHLKVLESTDDQTIRSRIRHQTRLDFVPQIESHVDDFFVTFIIFIRAKLVNLIVTRKEGGA
jgi:hypothetical protein